MDIEGSSPHSGFQGRVCRELCLEMDSEGQGEDRHPGQQ